MPPAAFSAPCGPESTTSWWSSPAPTPPKTLPRSRPHLAAPIPIPNLFSTKAGKPSSTYVTEASDGLITYDNLKFGDPLLTTSREDFESNVLTSGDYTYMRNNTAGASFIANIDSHPRTHTGYVVNGVLIQDSEKVESQTIDAGDPRSDYSREPTIPNVGFHGRRANLGAYGNTPEAALTKVRGFKIRLR